MNYREYQEVMKNVPYTEALEYCQAIMWLHPEMLPLGVYSTGEDPEGMVKIPPFAENRFGRKVPVIALRREAFSGKEKITDIVLPESIERLPAGTFAGCTGLKRITIPKKVRHIKEGTFAGCRSLEDVYYEGSMEDWRKLDIVHEKHEIEFGELKPGSPVQEVTAERLLHIPGNDGLFTANIHFNCRLSGLGKDIVFQVSAGGKDITEFLRTIH